MLRYTIRVFGFDVAQKNTNQQSESVVCGVARSERRARMQSLVCVVININDHIRERECAHEWCPHFQLRRQQCWVRETQKTRRRDTRFIQSHRQNPTTHYTVHTSHGI